MDTLHSLLREYERQRGAARRKADEAAAEAYARAPRLRDIAARRMRLGFERGLAQGQERGEIDAELTALGKEERALLASLGVTLDDLQPRYQCALCGDTGFSGDPVRRMCACLQRKLLQSKCQDAGLGASNASFEAFDLKVFPDEPINGSKITQRTLMERARAVVEDYAQNFPETKKRNLLLLGETGLGKTYLLDCVARRVLEKHYAVLKRTAYAFLSTMLRQIRERSGDAMDIFLKADLLLLDDLGSEPFIDNISTETLFSVLNERLIQGRHTIFATNMRMLDLHERYGERILTRVSDQAHTDIIQLRGQDVRFLSK